MWSAVVYAALIIGGGGAYALWAASMVNRGAPLWPFVVGLPLVYLALPLLFTCVWMLLGWWMRAIAPPTVRLTFPQRVRLFCNEFATIALSAPKMVFYRLLMRDPPPGAARLPVVLLHGVGCNAGVWDGFRRYLETRGLGPVYALSYGPPLASIEHFADQLAEKIGMIEARTGAGQVLLIGHSMGGLVARAYLRKAGGTRVRKLITIGTPHEGSRHAWLMSGTALAEMRPGSPFLTELNGTAAQAAGVPVVSLWSWHDSMVTPQTSSRLAWAENIVIEGVAHNALLGDRDVMARVADEVAKAADRPEAMPSAGETARS
jgi:triacylglycerol esterase/lipase EstA (alpha/beta hydrolase family)